MNSIFVLVGLYPPLVVDSTPLDPYCTSKEASKESSESFKLSGGLKSGRSAAKVVLNCALLQVRGVLNLVRRLSLTRMIGLLVLSLFCIYMLDDTSDDNFV